MATSEASTDVLPVMRGAAAATAQRPKRSRARRVAAWLFDPESRAGVYLGLAVVVAGFTLLAFTWSKVAATLAVPLQMPYLASGGLVGVGLIVVGIGTAGIAAKRRDSLVRIRQIERLADALGSSHGKSASSEGADGDQET